MDDSRRYIAGSVHNDSIINQVAAIPGKKPMTLGQIIDAFIASGFRPPRSSRYKTHREKVNYVRGYATYAVYHGFLDEVVD